MPKKIKDKTTKEREEKEADEEVTFTVEANGRDREVLGGASAKQARKVINDERLPHYEERVAHALNTKPNLTKLLLLSKELTHLQKSAGVPDNQKAQLGIWAAQVKAEIKTLKNNRSWSTRFMAGATAFFNTIVTGNFSKAWSTAKQISQKVWDEGLTSKEAYRYATTESIRRAATDIITEHQEEILKESLINPEKGVVQMPAHKKDKSKITRGAAITHLSKQTTASKEELAPGGAHKRGVKPVVHPDSVPNPTPKPLKPS